MSSISYGLVRLTKLAKMRKKIVKLCCEETEIVSFISEREGDETRFFSVLRESRFRPSNTKSNLQIKLRRRFGEMLAGVSRQSFLLIFDRRASSIYVCSRRTTRIFLLLHLEILHKCLVQSFLPTQREFEKLLEALRADSFGRSGCLESN